MTHPMHDEQLDRAIRAFLTWQAEDIADAPTATEMAIRISERAGARTRGLRLTPQLVWVVLAGLLILALIGAAVGALSLRQTVQPPLSKAYEAVFLRLGVVDTTPEVLVVGINPAGRERQIARLPGAWAAYDIQASDTERGFLAPMGAVSPGGLLAIPSNRGRQDMTMHWEIFDLSHPESAPIVVAGIEQFVEELRPTPYFRVDPRGGAFWGPGERLAILWYTCSASCIPDVQVAFVDGRTGVATPADPPGAVSPQWASDGSGVFIAGDRILRLDGSVTDAAGVAAEPSCRKRFQSGAEITASEAGIVQLNVDGSRDELLSRHGGVCVPRSGRRDDRAQHRDRRRHGTRHRGPADLGPARSGQRRLAPD